MNIQCTGFPEFLIVKYYWASSSKGTKVMLSYKIKPLHRTNFTSF